MTAQRPPVDDGTPAPVATPRRVPARWPTLGLVYGLVVAFAAWLIEIRPLIDNSFLIHLKTGHLILERGFLSADPYSFTAPGTEFVTQSWLAEAFFALLDQTFGPFAIRLWRGATCAVVSYAMFALTLRVVGDRTRALLLTVAAVSMGYLTWSERPLLFGILGMVALLWTVEAPDSWIGRRPLITIPVVLWLWANTHGSFPLGFAFLVLHLAGRWLDGARPWSGTERRLALGGLVAGLAILANPHGLSLLTFPIHLLRRGDVLGHIKEWQSPDFHSVRGMLFGAWVAVMLPAIGRRGGNSRRDVLVSSVFLLLAFWAVRNIVLVPLVCLPVAARAFARTPATPDRRSPVNAVVALLLASLAVQATANAAASDDYDFADYPVAAMEAVEDAGLLGQRLATSDAWGAYVIHAYWPRQQVFIDDRYDMYPTTLAEDYFALNRGAPGWEERLDRHGIEVVVWRVEKPLAALLDGDEGWRRIHRDDLAAVWVRVR